MTAALLLLPAAVALTCGSAVFLAPLRAQYVFFWACLGLGEALSAVFQALTGFWPGAVIFGAIALYCAWQWWRHWRRRRRGRARRALGAKSRALRDALVRRMRESLAPRRSPVPVPPGA